MAGAKSPKSHPPKAATRAVLSNTSKVLPRLNARLRGGKENPVRVASGGEGEWPQEMPVKIDVYMILGTFKHDELRDAEGLMGHVVDMDFYTKQTRLQIKLYRDPNAIAVEANGEEIYRWIENGDDLPTKFSAVKEDLLRVGGAWVDQVDLRPGDEVIQDGDKLVIIREDGTTESVDNDPILEDDEDEVLWE